jgi:hypothetical protein
MPNPKTVNQIFTIVKIKEAKNPSAVFSNYEILQVLGHGSLTTYYILVIL